MARLRLKRNLEQSSWVVIRVIHHEAQIMKEAKQSGKPLLLRKWWFYMDQCTSDSTYFSWTIPLSLALGNLKEYMIFLLKLERLPMWFCITFLTVLGSLHSYFLNGLGPPIHVLNDNTRNSISLRFPHLFNVYFMVSSLIQCLLFLINHTTLHEWTWVIIHIFVQNTIILVSIQLSSYTV